MTSSVPMVRVPMVVLKSCFTHSSQMIDMLNFEHEKQRISYTFFHSISRYFRYTIFTFSQGLDIKTFTQYRLILIISIFFVFFYNLDFYANTLRVYPFITQNYGFLFSLPVVLFTLTALIFTLVASKWTTKPMLIFALIASSMAAYFMDTYHVVLDDSMLRNTLQTDMKESLDLLSIKQVLYFIFLGLLPAYFVFKAPLSYRNVGQELFSKLKQSLLLILIMALAIFAFSKHYTSFAREHKPLRYSTNPTYWIYSVGKYIDKTFASGPIVVAPLGLDAKIMTKADALPKLIIMVVGEAVRADHFSLNGYSNETTPLLKHEDVLNLPHVSSCGTSTAASVPCMFSVYSKSEYSYKKGIRSENVLDVLAHTKKVSVLWRDNNSDSKGVAIRVPFEDYRTDKTNSICVEGECRDIGMLIGLNDYIKAQAGKDILIVLHQMGNHGPAYFKRYEKSFEKFTPVCETNQLEECSQAEISNAYDNAILYTDSFLVKTIALLKQHMQTHQTAMLYMSDHGESLGENGIYLHGLPYFMAPDAQTHVAALMWFDKSFKETLNMSQIDLSQNYSHDNLFHSLLGLFNVQTSAYKQQLDIFRANQ